MTSGYVDAFTRPVHSLGLPPARRDQLFRTINTQLFGTHDLLDLPLEVTLWNPNCSSYFDDGQEWWGAWFWTVHVRSSNRIVGIVASTTD